MATAHAECGIRYGRIRNLYLLTAFVGTTTGAMILVAPQQAGRVLGFPSELPEQDPIVFGIVGSIWLGVALLSLLGLRSPLKFLPLFLLQLVYKSLWFLFVFAPLAIQGEFPSYGTTLAVGNAVWMIMDLRAIPFRYLLSKEPLVAPVADARSEKSSKLPFQPAVR